MLWKTRKWHAVSVLIIGAFISAFAAVTAFGADGQKNMEREAFLNMILDKTAGPGDHIIGTDQNGAYIYQRFLPSQNGSYSYVEFSGERKWPRLLDVATASRESIIKTIPSYDENGDLRLLIFSNRANLLQNPMRKSQVKTMYLTTIAGGKILSRQKVGETDFWGVIIDYAISPKHEAVILLKSFSDGRFYILFQNREAWTLEKTPFNNKNNSSHTAKLIRRLDGGDRPAIYYSSNSKFREFEYSEFDKDTSQWHDLGNGSWGESFTKLGRNEFFLSQSGKVFVVEARNNIAGEDTKTSVCHLRTPLPEDDIKTYEVTKCNYPRKITFPNGFFDGGIFLLGWKKFDDQFSKLLGKAGSNEITVESYDWDGDENSEIRTFYDSGGVTIAYRSKDRPRSDWKFIP